MGSRATCGRGIVRIEGLLNPSGYQNGYPEVDISLVEVSEYLLDSPRLQGVPDRAVTCREALVCRSRPPEDGQRLLGTACLCGNQYGNQLGDAGGLDPSGDDRGTTMIAI